MIKSQFTKENQDFDVTNRVVSALTIDEDEQENSLRPHNMDEYVGQEKIKKNLDRKNYFNMDDDDSILRKNNLTIDFETTTWYAQFSNKLMFIGLEMQ